MGSVREEVEKSVGRGLPVDFELLFVDYLVAVHNFFDKLFGLSVVHVPNFLNAVLIGLHKVFELGLQISELFRKFLVLNRQVFICFLRLLLLCVVTLNYLPLNLFVPAFFFLLVLEGGLVDANFLLKHAVIEVELLLVKFVHCLHVLHALLKDLHLLFKLNFLFSLVVCIFVSELFQLLSVFFLHLGPPLSLFLLSFFVFLEQVVNFLFVCFENLGALVVEGFFNGLQVRFISFACLSVLILHSLNQFVNVLVHLRHGLNILLVLPLELILEFFYEVFLFVDNLLALLLLAFDFLYKTVTNRR